MAAALRGRAAIVAALLATAPWAAGTTNSLGETPLFKAAAVDEESALLLLAEAPGAATSRTSPNVWMRRQWSPLIAAAHAGMPRLVAALLAAAPEAAMLGDANGDLPLHWASQFGTTPAHAEARRLLLQAAPQAALVQDKDGDTPLMCAAIEGNGAAVAQLLAAAPEAAGVRNKRGGLAARKPACIRVGQQGPVARLQVQRPMSVGSRLSPALPAAPAAAGELPIQAALTPKALQRWGDDAEAARLLVHAGDAGDVAAALGVAAVTPSHEDRTATAAKLLIPELVAHRALTAAQWAALPAELPGLLGALPAVLARSEAEAARLMAHLPEPMRAHIQAAMLALARVQHRSHVSVPIVALQHIVSLAVAPSGRR